MAGIYIHIPFCRRACHYCNFHFSTTLHHKENLCEAITKELSYRKQELDGKTIDSIYFGGGTPSLLSVAELQKIIDAVEANYATENVKEFTLEANPDDMTPSYLEALSKTRINRLSIGIQSFEESHLSWMNRAHTAIEAYNCLKLASQYGFNALSLDLIYGLPELTEAQWQSNIEKALSIKPQHISAYCLTVENGTALAHQVNKGQVKLVDDEVAAQQFMTLRRLLLENGYEQYEISNFSLPGKNAFHNTNYWKGETYIGIGPGAHSFNGKERSWNISHNLRYIHSIEAGILPKETEVLSLSNQINEFIMTGLRTKWGINTSQFEALFGSNRLKELEKAIKKPIRKGSIRLIDGAFCLTESGLFFADGIAADLFQLEE